ncbi:hypothetical protein DL769_001044 [Monosporascus sp. CRB-8-3]|nr:hypothetical protein DL769_001044 [Monosporascus sp. CRB-8-3]
MTTNKDSLIGLRKDYFHLSSFKGPFNSSVIITIIIVINNINDNDNYQIPKATTAESLRPHISRAMASFTEMFFSLTGLQAKADGSSSSVDTKGEGYPKKCKCTKCENCGSGAEADTGLCKYCKDNCAQK